jgi:hypothetical protein
MNDDGTDRAASRLATGRAWDDFCETLRVAGHTLDRFGDDPTDLDRAEWYRFMTRLARNGFERFVENCEPDRPRLRDAPWRQGINFQSPDQDHLLCEFIDGARAYRIIGNRGTIPYFVIASWTAKQPADIGARDWAARGVDGLKEFDPATLQTTGFLQSDTIDFDADGNFAVIVSQTRPARTGGDRNWLRITPDCVGLLVRNVYHERAKVVPPTMRIELLDGAAPRPILAREVAANLAKTGQMVLGYAELVRSWWQDNLAQRPNRLRFSRATYLSNGGVADRHFAFGVWQVAPDQALVLEFTPPDCEYWIFQLCNMWQENLDNYEDGQGYVTKFTTRYEPDGLVRVVIAEDDPGIAANWISPFGHVKGGMGLRMIKTQSPPPVTSWLVALADLKEAGLACLTPERAIVSGEVVD